ncbi:MAG: hypothetical protein EP344_14770 [Bacteroidetes bacterium]|nr:MAG: hypothetical protein EP344_14770 [Bacteroidota bacterium]
MATIVILTTIFLSIEGYGYYSTPLEERFYHPQHDLFKASGLLGHGIGIVGTLLMLIGVAIYIARKRYKSLARFGRLKYWLEFHIFLCTLGPILVLFHTAFKFGGIVSIAFWSMVLVVLSGVIGRFIYIQIPRTIEGRAMSLHEVKEMKGDLGENLQASYRLDDESFQAVLALAHTGESQYAGGLFSSMFTQYIAGRRALQAAKTMLRNHRVAQADIRSIMKMLRHEISLNNRISRLQTMQNLFRYWHVAHLPFAIIMVVIVLFHVVITLLFGYKWIF